MATRVKFTGSKMHSKILIATNGKDIKGSDWLALESGTVYLSVVY